MFMDLALPTPSFNLKSVTLLKMNYQVSDKGVIVPGGKPSGGVPPRLSRIDTLIKLQSKLRNGKFRFAQIPPHRGHYINRLQLGAQRGKTGSGGPSAWRSYLAIELAASWVVL